MDEITLKALENTGKASDRGRWVLIVMQVACIVVFMAAWHEVSFSWTYARLTTARAAVWYLDCDKIVHLETANQALTNDEKYKHDECHFVSEKELSQPIPSIQDSTCKRTELAPFCSNEIERAKLFLVLRRVSPLQARKYLENLESSFVDHTINVAAPFLGVTLDVNDLGLLGAATFLLLLTWLLYSLRREEENLSILFKRASDVELIPLYHLLSMTQVFTIPPRTKMKRSRITEQIWSALAKILFMTPVGVELFVVWNDRMTLPIGSALNPKLANFEFYLETSLLTLMVLLTIGCLARSASISGQWTDAYDRVHSLQAHEEFC
jgi:hypothetical protein